MTAKVRPKAGQKGTPRPVMPTKVSAAKNTMAPWAKLSTPLALKMSTKPSATSEYMIPLSRPAMRTSKKNCKLSS